MSSLEERVAALESEVIRLREQVTDTHTLAAHADRDVAEFREELRGQTKLINATRLDMGDLRDRMTGLENRMTGLESSVDGGFAEVNAGLAAIVRMLDNIGGPSGPNADRLPD